LNLRKLERSHCHESACTSRTGFVARSLACSLSYLLHQGECHVHDNNGNPLTKLPLCVPDQPPGSVPIIGLDWYHGLEGYADPNAPTLALAFENGKIQVGNRVDSTIFFDENLISLSSPRDVRPSVSWTGIRFRRIHRPKRAHARVCFRKWQDPDGQT
jgi:hypothetical protein